MSSMGFGNVEKSHPIDNNRKQASNVSRSETEKCVQNNTGLSTEIFYNPEEIRENFRILNLEKITTLDLSHSQLTDLPICCKSLNLVHLNLAYNKLSSVPACLYNGLKQLETLNLSHNLINVFDIEPDCLTSLKKIKLNHNNFENPPKWFLMFKSTNLEEFNFSFNKASHYRYLKNSYNGNINKLRKLKLRNAHLIDGDRGFLKSFKQLQYLDISNKSSQYINKFYELDELFVKPKWRQLQVLKLNNLSIPFFPEGVAWLENLRGLYMNNNCMSWIPDGVEFMVNLEILDISHNTIIALPKQITKIVGLRTLLASYNYIEIVPDFSNMEYLTTIDLFDNHLSGISFNSAIVECIDLEGNFFDISELPISPELYKTKKEQLRLEYLLSRTDGPRLKDCEELDERTSESDEEYWSSEKCQSNKTFIEYADKIEDWNSPERVKPKDPNIETIDDDWTGEEKFFGPKIKMKEKKYVDDEDWMFEDVDEDYS